MKRNIFLTSKRIIIAIVLVGITIVVPLSTQAAYIFIDSPSQVISAEDNVIVEVRLNTEGKVINTVEGLIGIHAPNGPVYVRNIGLGNSDIQLWASKPSVTTQKNGASISFTGGTPGGFNKPDVLLFSIVLTATEVGAVLIAPASVVAYAHDGQGSPVAVRNLDLTLEVTPEKTVPEDQWQEVVKADSEPPAPFVINMGQDPALFDGKKFISFYTTDAGSGIDHYEVKEGEFDTVRSSAPYVLRNQVNPQPITVYAFDKAGNVRESHLDPRTIQERVVTKTGIVVLALIILIVCCIILVQWRRKQRKKHKQR